MINLFESYDEYTADLEHSLHEAGYNHKTVVLQDFGFLPKHVYTPLSFFSGRRNHRKKNFKTSPLFFNEVKIPYYWEIKGDSSQAYIFSGYKKVGQINYSNRKGDYRIVSSVDWYNAQNRIRQTDMYNQYGQLFCKKTFSDGHLSLTTYFDVDGRETIIHNNDTGIIELNWKHKVHFFKTYVDFIIFYLEKADLDTSQIFYNHLGVPYFVTNKLQAKNTDIEQCHTLFWQENSEKIPDNMWQIIKNKNSSTRNIVVQNQEEYSRILMQLKDIKTNTEIEVLGYLYPLVLRKELTKTALIVTNSDNIEQLDALTERLPDIQFNIAARTTMSPKLLAYEARGNINLYPLITDEKLQELIKESSFYFDINKGSQVENMLRKSFENNQLIIAFTTTVHDYRYVNRKNIFKIEEIDEIIKLVNNSSEFVAELKQQQKHAGQETIKRYKEVLV